MDDQKCIVIGGSAGSLDFIFEHLNNFELHNNTIMIVVLHRKSSAHSSIENTFRNKTEIEVSEIEDKEKIGVNTIYICPADYHLLIEQDRSFSLDFSERVKFNRPSIDIAFEEVAKSYKKNAIAILLSGANNDGMLGCDHIQKYGGITIVQDPKVAVVPYMPNSAIEKGYATHVLNNNEIVEYINKIK